MFICTATAYWHKLIASIATNFKEEDIYFAIANEEDFMTDIKLLGMEDWGEDVTVGIFAPQNVRYPMKEELYPETLREFVQDFLKGKLTPHLRSESVPRKSKGALIQTVVGSTFEKFMSNPSKNCLIKLCMPEAKDCEDAEKHFNEVVIRYEGSEEVIFGEMNMACDELQQQIASILITPHSSIILHFIDVQLQSRSSDCGLFAIAYATALVFGEMHASEFLF